MLKISFYIFLTFIYLGISSFTPSGKGPIGIVNERVFNSYFKGAPLSIILFDSFQTGLFIKTYYHKYKVIRGLKSTETVSVRVSKAFWFKNLKNHGMSLFRREEKQNATNFIVMPPGILYVGNRAYGQFEDHGSEIRNIWRFHGVYRHFTDYFYWGDFRPSQAFYSAAKYSMNREEPFYGLNNEFGTNGSVTKKYLKKEDHKKKREQFSFKKHLLKFL